MLKEKNTGYIFSVTDYAIKEVTNGKDELTFEVPADSEDAAHLVNEMEIVEEVDKNDPQSYPSHGEFVVKDVDGDDSIVSVTAKLNLDDFKREMRIGFNKTGSPFNILNEVVPEGWTVEDHTEISESKTVELDGATAIDVADSVVNIFGVAIRYDFEKHTQNIYDPKSFKSTGEYITKELNLLSLSRYSSSESLANRLYARGKDGLTFASINDGKDYVEDTSYLSGKVVCGPLVKDDRFEDPESLLAYTKQQLESLCKPTSSYECSVADISSDAKYAFLKLDLLSVVTLLDSDRNVRVDHQVVERVVYPNDKTKNQLTLSTVLPTLTGETSYVSDQISSSSSEFRKQLQSEMDRIANAVMQAAGGYIIINYGDDGKMAEMLVMDTNDKETAKNVMRINMGGIAFSTSGYNGPFNSAWSLSGEFFAQFIATWKLTADIIIAGKLQDKSGNSYWDLDNGEMVLNGRFKNSDGNYATDFWAAVYTMLHGAYQRIRLYSSAGEEDETTGVIQVSHGKFTMDSGFVDELARATRITGTYMHLGESRDGGCDGKLIAGSVSSQEMNAEGMNAKDMNVSDSFTCKGILTDGSKVAVGDYGTDLKKATWGQFSINGQTVTLLTKNS